jgi:hypothetical protein
MSIRHVTRRVIAGLGAVSLAGLVSVLAFGGSAWAVGPTQGSQVPNSAQCQGASCPGGPFSSGQTVKIVIPANSVFSSGVSIHIIECAKSVVTATTDALALPLCDGLTGNGDTVLAGADGSFTYTNQIVYALPDTNLGEGSTNTPKCDTSNACVFYIGTDSTHPFSSPHFFSQTFSVKFTTGDTGANPGDGTPEVPLAIGLPLLAAGLLGGTLFLRRRRSAAAISRS